MRDPTQVGPYQLVRRIGRGGTGRTYLGVRDASRGGVLACIKTPHPAFARDAGYLELFDHEAAVAATLDSPHIVSLMDRGVSEDGMHYLAYPYIEGTDLAELIASVAAQHGQLGWNLVALMTHQSGLALESAHADHRGSGRHHERAPIVHRDICPANILIGLSGAAYLADFGFARAAEGAALQPSLSGAGRFAYAAPERLLDDGAGYGPRADLFSLGVSLFEALTNRRPFAGGSIEAHVRHVLDGDRARVEDHRAEFLTRSPIHPGLRQLIDVVHRLIEPDPRDRYPSAAALVDDVRAILLPAGTHREIAQVAHAHMPAWRRAVKLTTGKREVVGVPAQEDGVWSGTDPLQREHLANKAPDSVWVSPAAASKLIASYVIGEPDPELDTIDSTVRDRPVMTAPPLSPDDDATVLDRPVLHVEASSESPSIPTTNPFRGVVRIEVDEPIPTTISTSRPVVNLKQLEANVTAPQPADASLWIARAVLVAVPVILAATSAGLLLVPDNAWLNGMGGLGLSLAAASALGWIAWRVRNLAGRGQRRDSSDPLRRR